MKNGLFITFEGGDGAGKSTQINILKSKFEEKGYEVLVTREPGGTVIGEKIRGILLDKQNIKMDSFTECFLYAASRAQHVKEVILPALEKGLIVISDRYIDSSYAYQGYARELGNAVWDINSYAVGDCMPDLTFFLKLDPKDGKERIKKGSEDRIELEKLDFHKKVYNGYIDLCDRFPERIIPVKADESVSYISDIIWENVKRLLDERK